MLDIGFSEILLTSVIALVVLGPERLPKVAKQVGSWVGRARAMARQLGEQLDREVSNADITQFDLSPKKTDPGAGATSPQPAPSSTRVTADSAAVPTTLVEPSKTSHE